MGFFDFIYPEGRSPEVTAVQARDEQATGVPLVDIRDVLDWNNGHAAGARHVPQARLRRPSSGLGPGERVILMCTDGDRSRALAADLKESGWDVTSVHGGLTAWRRAGLPVEPA